MFWKDGDCRVEAGSAVVSEGLKREGLVLNTRRNSRSRMEKMDSRDISQVESSGHQTEKGEERGTQQ